jgi:hypothetical protein
MSLRLPSAASWAACWLILKTGFVQRVRRAVGTTTMAIVQAASI